jgi:hypothetical protein
MLAYELLINTQWSKTNFACFRSLIIVMLKIFPCGFFLLMWGCAYSQDLTDHSCVITSMTGKDMVKNLYMYNAAGNRLFAYKVDQGVSGTLYELSTTPKGLQLYCRPLQPGQLSTDSLLITFDDLKHIVRVGANDHYELYPAYYAIFKNMTQVKHRVVHLLQLLSMPIGDHTIDDPLPWLAFNSPLSEHIRGAHITTQRGQADVTDNWTVRYGYQHHKLVSVNAADSETTRFTERVIYSDNKIKVNTILNIEDRQITTTEMTYKPGDNKRRIYQRVEESGKDREVRMVTDMMMRMMRRYTEHELSTKQIMDLVK